MAQKPQEEKEPPQGHHWVQAPSRVWEARYQTSEAEYCCAREAPFLEHSRITSEFAPSCNGVVLPQLPEEQSGPRRVLQAMQQPLVQGLEETKKGSQPKPKEQGGEFQSQSCRRQSPTEPARGHQSFHGECTQGSLGTINSRGTTGTGSRQQRCHMGDATTACPSASTSGWQGFHFGGGSKTHGHIAGIAEDGAGAIASTNGEASSSRTKEESGNAAKGVGACPHQSSQQGQGSAKCSRGQDQEDGRGVDTVHAKYHQEGCQSRSTLSSMPHGTDAAVPEQDCRPPRDQGGNQQSFDVIAEFHTRRGATRGDAGHRRQAQQLGECPVRSSKCDRAAHGVGRRDGRTGIDSGWGQSSGQGGSQKAHLPSCQIATEGGSHSPENEEGSAMNTVIDSIHISEQFPMVYIDDTSSTDCTVEAACTLECQGSASLYRSISRGEIDVPDAEVMTEDKCKDEAPCDLSQFCSTAHRSAIIDMNRHLGQNCIWAEHCLADVPCSDHLPCASKRRISFDPEVQVHIFHEDRRVSKTFSINTAHELLRCCWTLDGNDSSFLHSSLVLSSSQERIGRDFNDGSCVLQESFGSEQKKTDAASTEAGAHEVCTYLHSVGGQNSICKVETWYVCRGRHEVCRFPRSVVLMPGFDVHVMVQTFRDVWADLIMPGSFQIDVVRNAPASSPMTRAQIIITQYAQEGQTSHLLHWDAWPILGKFRAILLDQASTVEQVLCKANGARPRNIGLHAIAAHFQDSGPVVHLSQAEVFDVPSAVVLFTHIVFAQPPEPDSDSQSNVSASESTRTPDDVLGHSDEDDDEMMLMTAATPTFHFDPHGPFPWQIDEDVALAEGVHDEDEVMADPPGLIFDQDHHFQMTQQVAFLQSQRPTDEEHWVAITFGVGLVGLGRRDLQFAVSEIDALVDRIRNLWNDHIQYGEADLFFVTPQPEALHRKRYLVFLVSIQYGDPPAGDCRRILMRGSSNDPSVISPEPYGAVVYNQISPRAILSQVGHHECFPFGSRDCNVRLEGLWLQNFRAYEIRNGALCDAFIGPFPNHIQVAEQFVENAESLFRIARSHFENCDGSTTLILRAHGISPENRPLGYRDLVTDYPDLLQLHWIPALKNLWPFNEDKAGVWFVSSGKIAEFDMEQTPVLHFIVTFDTQADHCPVLVQQSIFAVQELRRIEELWAISIPRQNDEQLLTPFLLRKPFWFHPIATTHLTKHGRRLDLVQEDWMAGDVLELKLNMHSVRHMLVALLEIENGDMRQPRQPREQSIDWEFEEVSMIQLHVEARFDEVHSVDSAMDSAFAELCRACADCADTEDNLGISQTNGFSLHQGLSCGGEDQPGLVCADKDRDDTVDTQAWEQVLPDKELMLGLGAMIDNSGSNDFQRTSHTVTLSLEAALPVEVDLQRAEEFLSCQWFEKRNWYHHSINQEAPKLIELPEGLKIKKSTYHMLTSDK